MADQPEQDMHMLMPLIQEAAQARQAAAKVSPSASNSSAPPPQLAASSKTPTATNDLSSPPPPGPQVDYFAGILKELDPYRSTPMEFISLLLHAAIRDSAVATELHRLRAEKTQNPDTWRPIIPVAVGDPHPATPQSPHNQFASTATGQSVRYQRAPADHVVQPRHSSHPDVKMESPGDGRPPLDHSKVDPALTDFKPKQSDDTESREGPCDFTWVLDQAQHYLGWKEELDGPSGSSRASLGTTAAIEIQKLLKEMNAQMDKHENFANRVHILSVMREVIFTAVAADTPLGRECRAVSQTYDLSTLDHSPDYNMLGRPQAYDVCFLLAARKLTSEQRKKLQVLEGGKWMNELQQLVMQATQKDCYPLLEQTLVWIDAFH